MSTVTEHYENLLADHYSRMFGDFDEKVAEQRALLERLGVAREGAGDALDLGCGSGFQSIALAQLGFRVRAVDLSEKLLAELTHRRGDLPVEPLQGNIRDAGDLALPGTEVIVCMGDTLTHLEASADVTRLLAGCASRLAPGGRLVLTFRDLTRPLEGLDRFLSVRSDPDLLMTCVLEYEAQTVKVHDLVHARAPGGGWTFSKSFYRKLRLSPYWVAAEIEQAGLAIAHREAAGGLVTLVARR